MVNPTKRIHTSLYFKDEWVGKNTVVRARFGKRLFRYNHDAMLIRMFTGGHIDPASKSWKERGVYGYSTQHVLGSPAILKLLAPYEVPHD